MSEVISGGLSGVINEYSFDDKKSQQNKELGKDEFLKLLVVQLQNQDPLSPQDNGEFIAQLAQFSSLEEQKNLTKSFESFADQFQSSQHLQATSLVGRPVHVASDTTLLSDQGVISVLADIPIGTDAATLSVFNDTGALIDSFELGEQTAGRNEFIWTGTDSNEVRYPPGIYKISVTVAKESGAEEVPVFLSSNVNSVTIEPGGSLTLNLAGIGPTPMSEVLQIN